MRSIHRLCVTTVFAGAMLVSSASAMDLATYDTQRRAPPNSQTQVRLRVYLLGVGEGLKLANAQLAQRGEPPLFCLPDSGSLFAEDYFKLIDAALKDSRETFEREQRSIESILLSVLREARPCPARGTQDPKPPAAEMPATPASAPASGAERASAPASAATPASAPASGAESASVSAAAPGGAAASSSAMLPVRAAASAPARRPGWGASTP